MSEDSDSVSEEERSLFRPFTRESLAAIEARIAEEHAKQKELEKKRAEGEVGTRPCFFFIHVWRKMVSRHRFERNLCWLADYRDFFFSNLHFRSIQIHKFSIQLFMHTFYMIDERFHSTFLLRSKKCFVFNSFDQTIQIGLWIIINFEEVQFRWCHLIRGNFVLIHNGGIDTIHRSRREVAPPGRRSHVNRSCRLFAQNRSPTQISHKTTCPFLRVVLHSKEKRKKERKKIIDTVNVNEISLYISLHVG